MASAKISSAQSSPPPAYDAADDLASQLSNVKIADLDLHSETPNSSQTITHLKLLNSIHHLRQDISSRNGLFGLEDCLDSSKHDPQSPTSTALSLLQDQIREKRWAVYVARAVDRFTVWWEVMKTQNQAVPIDIQALENQAGKEAVSQPVKTDGRWLMDAMPPLDVLMIWHCFMLNPRAFLEDCLRQGMISLWNRGMPWTAVNAVIDTESGAYRAGSNAQTAWETSTRLPWDNLSQSDTKVLECPGCKHVGNASVINIPWTTSGDYLKSCAQTFGVSREFLLETYTKQINKAAESGSGYADKRFNYKCRSCYSDIDHDLLQGYRFLTDAKGLEPGKGQAGYSYKSLLENAKLRPLKGTLLSSNGTPTSLGTKAYITQHAPNAFPNRIVAAMAALSATNNPYSFRSLDAVRGEIEIALKDLTMLQFAEDSHKPRIRISREKRIAIRRMMARYWNNSSPFAIDLAGACIRQGSFISKMADIDWLHSPALASTTQRLLTKYTRFVHIMATYPDDMAVPTLDVDLGWHTHQLTPRSYYDYTVKKTRGTFLDHDDKVAETALNTAFAKTCARYQSLYQEPYSSCTCWYCEAIRAEHASSTSQRLFHRGTNRDIEAQLHDAPDGTSTSHGGNANETTPHISAHNAIRPTQTLAEQKIYAARLASTQQGLRLAYEKACKRARKEKRNPPPPPPGLDDEKHRCGMKSRGAKDDEKSAYGYSYAYAAGMPYMADPCMTSGVYVCDPGCASMAAGSAGACAAGTCGGAVAAGSCAAAGAMGSCAGGSGSNIGAGCGSSAGGSGFGGCGGGGASGGGGGGCGGGGGGGGC